MQAIMTTEGDEVEASGSGLPPVDPAEGHAAALAADEARKTALEGITAGTTTLDAFFAEVDAETDHHTLGHVHVRALLEALPHIGDVKSAKILDDLGIKHDEHVDVLGSQERAALTAAVTAA